MKARLMYEQSATERYDSDQNDMVEELLRVYSIEVTGSAGGVGADGRADNELDVEGARMDITSAVEILRASLKRPIEVVWIWPWARRLNELKWNLWYRPLLAWQRRNEPSAPKCVCPPERFVTSGYDFDSSVLAGEHHLERCPLWCFESDEYGLSPWEQDQKDWSEE